MRDFFIKALNIGIRPGMDEGKKFAIQVMTFDGYWTFFTVLFHACYSWYQNLFPLTYIFAGGLFFLFLGQLGLARGYYDFGRSLIHLTGLFELAISIDTLGLNSGFEYYYFINVTVPFVTFTLEERWKAHVLAFITCSTFVFQQIYGTGLLMTNLPSDPQDKLVIGISVFMFLMAIFTVTRWQLKQSLKEIKRHQDDLIFSANMIALGEMSANIAHEINNPLQSLSLQMRVVQEKFQNPEFQEHFSKMDNLIFKMAKMVQGLRDLSRKDGECGNDIFLFSKILEDVLAISANKIKEERIRLYVNGDADLKLKGNSVQISQIIVNLLNNAVDAVKGLEDKWIKINISTKSSFIEISVMDSGNGIPQEVVKKMMNPFFTTKASTKGTGLGLSISKNIAEKNSGKLYYDSDCENTRFVLILPLVEEVS